MTESNVMNTGDLIFTLLTIGFMLIPLILAVAAAVYIIRLVKRTERRSEERLQLDKEKSATQTQQLEMLQSLNRRLTTIEKFLKDVQ
ncbi:hypothetical protein [Planococcus lenghuensis]|uniref:Uncharacterized protein n=1 Tax=Planococcus lenghuensis TaxID=2213202 RepID=A0A1Q2KWQ4_9BACL|nr:hypothetical protein [Planococcus lenghuensis]AQQ52621.1 hypothetical protein B0X71_05590 [Planococcus lenghuensis]